MHLPPSEWSYDSTPVMCLQGVDRETLPLPLPSPTTCVCLEPLGNGRQAVTNCSSNISFVSGDNWDTVSFVGVCRPTNDWGCSVSPLTDRLASRVTSFTVHLRCSSVGIRHYAAGTMTRCLTLTFMRIKKDEFPYCASWNALEHRSRVGSCVPRPRVCDRDRESASAYGRSWVHRRRVASVASWYWAGAVWTTSVPSLILPIAHAEPRSSCTTPVVETPVCTVSQFVLVRHSLSHPCDRRQCLP